MLTHRFAKALLRVACAVAVAVSLSGCSVVSDLTRPKHATAASSTAAKNIAQTYKTRLAALGSTDIVQLFLYNGNVSVTGWVGDETKTATQMGTVTTTVAQNVFTGGSLPADKFDITALNQRLTTSTQCAKDPMLMVSVAPTGKILEQLVCAGNLMNPAAWLDGKPLTVVPKTVDLSLVTNVLSMAAVTLGDKVDMIQFAAIGSYARANVKTARGTITVADAFHAGGTPTLSLLMPTLQDGPQLSLTTVTPAVVWAGIQKVLASAKATIDQSQVITVMIKNGKPVVDVVLTNGTEQTVAIG